MPELGELRSPVTETVIVVVVVEVVGGQLAPFLDVNHCTANEFEVVRGEADGVGVAGMIDDGGDREQSLDVDIPVWILADNVSVRINNSHHMSNFPLSKIELADVHNEIHHTVNHLVFIVRHLGVVHQHVQQSPGIRLILLQPEHS